MGSGNRAVGVRVRKIADLIGKRFGDWTIIGEAERELSFPPSHPNGSPRRIVICRCTCGTIRQVRLGHLHPHGSTSCGCVGRLRIAAAARTHGRSHTPMFRLWAAIKNRCFNSKTPGFPYYGGRGIGMWPHWIDSFEYFEHDVLTAIGPKPGPEYSLDRWPDNNGNYEVGNIRWSTRTEQAQNRRPWKRRTVHGESRDDRSAAL
jgi:hypothetical protein